MKLSAGRSEDNVRVSGSRKCDAAKCPGVLGLTTTIEHLTLETPSGGLGRLQASGVYQFDLSVQMPFSCPESSLKHINPTLYRNQRVDSMVWPLELTFLSVATTESSETCERELVLHRWRRSADLPNPNWNLWLCTHPIEKAWNWFI